MTYSFRCKATFVIALAIVVRLAFVIAVQEGKVSYPASPDMVDYFSFAHNLATGVGFAHAVNEGQPFSKPVEFSAWRPPLFPAFLAIAFQFSRNILFLRLLQVAVAGISAFWFLRIGFVLFGELPALIACLTFAIYPPLVIYSADLASESLFLLLTIGVLFVYYAPGNQRSLTRVAGLGVLVGLAALCRPNGLLLAPALALAIVLTTRGWRQAVRELVVLGMALAMVVLPWTYRNYRLFHQVVLITTAGGPVLWSGVHLRLDPGASLNDLHFVHLQDAFPETERQRMEMLSEPEQEQYFYQKAFKVLDHSPRRFALMVWRNFEAMYTLVPSAQYHSLSNRVLYSISYIPLLLTGVAGWILLLRRWRDLSLLWAWALFTTAFYCFCVIAIRYRVPTIDPILMLGTGVFVDALARVARRNSMRNTSPAGL
jgi:4-amino-4-deoxy-L-arabinose transferase-like glycosyltransferase